MNNTITFCVRSGPLFAALSLAVSFGSFAQEGSHSYTVMKGDSLSSISKSELGRADRWREILELNPAIQNPAKITVGQTLKMPAASNFDSGTRELSLYEVRRGDSMSGLALRFIGDASQWRRIWSLNSELKDPEKLVPGTKLKVIPEWVNRDLSMGEERSLSRVDESMLPKRAAKHLNDSFVQESEASFSIHEIRDFLSRYKVVSDGFAGLRISADSKNLPDDHYIYAEAIDMRNLIPSGVWGVYRKVSNFGSDGLLELQAIAETKFVEGTKFTLRVTRSRMPFDQDSVVLPMEAVRGVSKPGLKSSNQKGELRVVRVFHEETNGPIVLIDRGTDQNLEEGDILYYYKKDHVVGSKGSTIEWPTAEAGTMAVFSVGLKHSFAKVLRSHRNVSVGDRVLAD